MAHHQNLMKQDECRLQFGDFSLSLQFGDIKFASALCEYYAEYLTTQAPDIEIEIVLKDGLAPILDSPLLDKWVEGDSFSLYSGKIAGFLNLRGRRGRVEIPRVLFYGGNIFLFEKFLAQTYYSLLRAENEKKEPNNFLLHASAVLKEGKGYIFTGPPESGKTTIVELSKSTDVLHDEVVLVGKEEGIYQVRSTLLTGKYPQKKNGKGKLEAIFFLVKDKEVFVERERKVEAYRKITPQIVLSTPLLSRDDHQSLIEMATFSFRLVQEIPFYKLHFRQDESFWRVIDNLS